jgi:HPt (histidine-containing phosphotransfer) domain-containing protein
MIEAHIREQFPPDVLKQALEIFIEDSDESFKRLNESDPIEVRKLAHKIRGSSGMLGAMKLHHLATKIETDLENMDLAQSVDQLKESYFELRSYINQEFLA